MITAPAPGEADTEPEPGALSTHLRCGGCGRGWLAPGDLRHAPGAPCPYCGGGPPGVLGVVGAVA